MNVDTISRIATDILNVCRSAYDEDGSPDLPGRALIHHGLPPADCEQLVVAIRAIRAVNPFPNTEPAANECIIVPAVDLTIVVVRTCWPTVQSKGITPRTPTAEEIARASALLASDAAALFAVVTGAALTGALIPSIRATCAQVNLGSLAASQPSGGFAGWSWPLTVQIG